MAIKEVEAKGGPLVLVTSESGVTVIPQPTPLTRLNYFDGKFLRASDLTAEQRYLRRLVQLSNQAGGAGVVHGYDLTLTPGGESLNLGEGLAIDPDGRVLLLPAPASIGVQTLIDRSRAAAAASLPKADGSDAFGDCAMVVEAPPDSVVRAGDLYLIVIAFAEALCGQEDVFGKLCEEACATSTDRPYLVEGLIVRALPLQLRTPLPMSAVVALSRTHLRSRVASAYFQDERERVASFISGDGLRSNVWCLGADAAGGRDVPIGVLARSGGTTLFLDAWTARRERMDGPAKRYWQWRMAMRPWDVFVAQILQFQCQLRDLFQGGGTPSGGDDPCADKNDLIRQASAAMMRVARFYREVTTRFTFQPLMVEGGAAAERPPVLEGGLTFLDDVEKRLQLAAGALTVASSKILVDGGIVEIPSAGYLPVDPSATASVNQQVRRLLGDGVDLRFCIVRPDFVAHALEEAEHMERISLLEGLDRPHQKPQVDILVPEGESLDPRQAAGVAFEAEISFAQALRLKEVASAERRMLGAAHVAVPESGKVEFYTAVSFDTLSQPGGDAASPRRIVELDRTFLTNKRIRPAAQPADGPDAAIGRQAAASPPLHSLWGAAICSINPFTATGPGSLLLDVRLVLTTISGGTAAADDVRIVGTVSFNQPQTAGSQITFNGRLDGMLSVLTTRGGTTPDQSNSRMIADVAATLSNSNPSEPTVTLNFFNRENNIVVTFDIKWGGTPRVIQAAISSTMLGDDGGTTRPFFTARFRQNDDVLQPSHMLHARALRALDAIGDALADNQFAPVSAALLFPAPPAPTPDLQVRATRDWVLFHRRRTKQCQVERPVPRVSPRRYQLWHGRATNVDLLTLTLEALRSGGRFDPQAVVFQRVTIVEFAPGVQTLTSSPQAILEDWKNVPAGQRLLYAGIASGDEAKKDGVDLARARLQQVSDVVSSVSSPTSNTITEVMERVHPDLAVPGVDGIVVAFTKLETTCATVLSTRSLDRVTALLANNNLSSAIALGTDLGEVVFRQDTADVVGDGLERVRKAWEAAGHGGRPLQAITVLRQGDNTLTKELAAKQTMTIESALGDATAPRVTRVSAELPRCPVVIFIEPQEALTRNALLVYGNFDVENGSFTLSRRVAPTRLQFRDDQPQGNVLQTFLAAIAQVGLPLKVVMLSTSGQPDDHADERLAAVMAALRPAAPREFVNSLTAELKEALRNENINPDEFDEVIVFSELNLQGPR